MFGRYYLGVYPTSAGYKTFNVEPSLGGMKEFKGCAPVNGGIVTVSLTEKALSVTAAKEAGTLIWQVISYNLVPNEAFIINFK